MSNHSSESTDDSVSNRRTYGGRPPKPKTASNRLVERRDPVPESSSGLLSRDHQPRHGGPELIASWPLGVAPGQTEPGNVDWTVESTDFVQLQRNLTVNQFLGPIEFTRIYMGVRGRAHVSPGETLTLRLSALHLEGEQYETTIELRNEEMEPFMTPMVELTPDARDYREHAFIGREMYGGYVLSARVSDGSAHIDQGTGVHLWSE